MPAFTLVKGILSLTLIEYKFSIPLNRLVIQWSSTGMFAYEGKKGSAFIMYLPSFTIFLKMCIWGNILDVKSTDRL